jgi:hypothetical protein
MLFMVHVLSLDNIYSIPVLHDVSISGVIADKNIPGFVKINTIANTANDLYISVVVGEIKNRYRC